MYRDRPKICHPKGRPTPNQSAPRSANGGNRTYYPGTFRQFIGKCTIRPADQSKLHGPARPDSYNDDLSLVPFRLSRYKWSGEQRNGIAMHIAGATLTDRRTRRGIDDFFYPQGNPAPDRNIRTHLVNYRVKLTRKQSQAGAPAIWESGELGREPFRDTKTIGPYAPRINCIRKKRRSRPHPYYHFR